MVATTTNASVQPRPKRRRRRALVRGLAIVNILLVVWTVVGVLRAEAAARDYFGKFAAGDTHANVTVQVTPAILPFWAVVISGNVIESDQPYPKYRSYMRFWIEPLSGWVISLGNG